jgi:hypothetical protein
MLLLLSVMTTAIQPTLGFAATFIGSKIGHEISCFISKILISILILGYLRIIISKSSLINEASANALLETSYILITLFITYFTKESLKLTMKEKKLKIKLFY